MPKIKERKKNQLQIIKEEKVDIDNTRELSKRGKNGVQPKAKIIQTTSLLLDYNCKSII